MDRTNEVLSTPCSPSQGGIWIELRRPHAPPPAIRRGAASAAPPRAASLILTLSLAVAALAPSPASGHLGEQEQLAEINTRLSAGQMDAPTYLERAEVYRLEGDWASARADYARAQALAPDDPDVALGLAALLFDEGRAPACEAALDRLLAAAGEQPGVLELRGRARAAQGRFRDAAADYDRLIEIEDSPTPDHYIDRARWLEAAGPGAWEEALRGVDRGISRLGSVPGFVIEASEIESRLGRFADARARLNRFDAELTMRRTQPVVRDASPASEADATVLPERSGRPAPGPDRAWPADDGGSSNAPLTITRGPYLQQGSPTRIVIRWRTNVPTDARVRFGVVGKPLKRWRESLTMTTEHVITVSGLSAGSVYQYTVGTAAYLSGCTLATCTFRTSPYAGTPGPTRVWVIGDSGKPGPDAAAVRDAFTSWSGARGSDVWLMLGDNAYTTGTDAQYQNAVFDMYGGLLAQNVLWPTRGNHDALHGSPAVDYYDIFSLPKSGECGGLPSGTEAYYAFDYANIHFVCLDSQASSRARSGPMMRWLESDLAATAQPWIVAYWHHPPYSKGSHDSDDAHDSGGRMRDMRQVALGILDSAGVDLVLTGHSHAYERSVLLRGHYGVSTTLTAEMKVDAGDGRPDGDGAYHKPTPGKAPLEGAVYAVAGSSSHTEAGPLNHPVMVTSLLALGSVVLDVAGLRLDARFLDERGVVRDSFAIVKGASGASSDPLAAVSRGGGMRELAIGPIEPNPVLAGAHIGCVLPRAGRVRVRVLDASGRLVRVLADGAVAAGTHEFTWDARDAYGAHVAAGIYFAEIVLGGRRSSARFAVLQ